MLTTSHIRAALFATVFLVSTAAYSAPSTSVFLEDLTWTELRDRVASGDTTILVPIGGTEQSGPAVALGKHNARVRVLAEQIASSLGHTLIAPVIAYVPEGSISPPSGHMKFPGTLTIDDRTFIDLLASTGRSLKAAGFTTIVFIGDHGGYQSDETQAADRLSAEWKGSPVKVLASLTYYKVSQGPYDKALLAAGVTKGEIGTHAGLADTSLLLATAPSLVRVGELPHGSQFGTKEGVYGGDPTRSSAQLGQLGVRIIVEGTVREIRAFEGAETK
jgi:creatinine amidohydrolase/Fe(II)-dependent formamide hydrolase-like protein